MGLKLGGSPPPCWAAVTPVLCEWYDLQYSIGHVYICGLEYNFITTRQTA